MNKLFKVMTKRKNNNVFREAFLKILNISEKVGITFLFGKGLNRIIGRVKIRAKDAFIIFSKMFFNYITGSMFIDMIVGSLRGYKSPEPVTFPSSFIYINGVGVW